MTCKKCAATGDIQWGLCPECRAEADRQWAASNSEDMSEFDTPSHDGLYGWNGSVQQDIEEYLDREASRA